MAKRIKMNFNTNIYKRYLEGESANEIAKSEDCSGVTIRNYLKKQGIKRVLIWSNSKIPQLSISEKAYIAGLLDGEGTISDDRKRINGCWRIRIVNTDKNLMKWLKKTIPTSNIYCSKLKNRKNMYSWTLAKWYSCYSLIKQIYPFLIIKKKKAKILLDNLEEKLSI